MKHTFNQLLGFTIIILSFVGAPVLAYDLELRFLVDDPALFPMGRFIPPGISDANDIAFEDIAPIFAINMSGTGPDSIYVIVRLESEGQDVFTVSSLLFHAGLLLGQGWLDNYVMARIPGINLGQGSSQVNANRLMPFLNGSMVREGLYQLTVVISIHDDWETALGDNAGVGSLFAATHNVSQVQLITPEDGAGLQTPPIFLWSYPRTTGVVFHLKLVSGNPQGDPWSELNSAADEFIYADIDIPVTGNNAGGDFSAHIYSGLGLEKALAPNLTYYWKISAQTPTVFQNEFEDISSQVFKFTYAPPSGGGIVGGGAGGAAGGGSSGGYGGGGQGEGGQNEGGSASDGVITGGAGRSEGGGSPPEPPVFTILRGALPPEVFDMLVASLGDLTQYRLIRINIGGRDVSLDELAALILTGEIQITSATVSP